MKQHVSLQGAHEEQCACARIGHVHRPGLVRASEVSSDEQKRAARRRVLRCRIERQLQRGPHCVFAHGHDDARREDACDEWHDLFSNATKDDAGIGFRIDSRQLANGGRRIHRLARGHRLGKESFLRSDVPKNRSGRDSQRCADLGERPLFESPSRENASGRFKDLFT
jgi:hypothetical protein